MGLAVEAGGPQVGAPVGRIGCVEGEDTPVACPGRVRDGPAVEVGYARHIESGEEEYAAFDGQCAQDLAAHHGAGEGGGRPGRSRCGCGSPPGGGRCAGCGGRRSRTRRRTGAVPRGCPVCWFGRRGWLEVGGVGAGEGEEGAGPVDVGGLEHAVLGDVAEDHGHVRAAGECDAPCIGVFLDADDRGAEFAQSGQQTRVLILPRPSSTMWSAMPRGRRRRLVAERKDPRASRTAATRTGRRSRPTRPAKSCGSWRSVGSPTAGSLMEKRSRRVT